MKFTFFFLFLFLMIVSCSETKGDNQENVIEDDPKNMPLEEMADRHVRATLDIQPDEKFTIKIYREHLDGDDKIDAVITVNRLNYALEEAAKSDNSAKQAEVGFTGNYNYIFYYDGHLDQISPDIKIASSAHGKLNVSFEHISSDAYKDVLVDYKIRNSSFRDFFTIMNHSPILVFQWKIYDRLGEDNPEAIYFEYAPGTQSTAKDILLYTGKLENAGSVGDIYTFEPKISKKGELLHRFFYLDTEGKYFTKKVSMEHSFQHPKTFRYFTHGDPEKAKIVLYVLHGYGQLAEYFIQKFHGLGDVFFIVLPEGMHRFYVKGSSGRVGASWMTKEARECDITDTISFLDEVENRVNQMKTFDKKIVLGFSQGGATAARWTSFGSKKPNAAIFWASVFPPDLENELSFDKGSNNNNHFVLGNEDEYFTPEEQEKTIALYAAKGFNTHHFMGKHTIDFPTLKKVLTTV